jgi:hypothetical protein
MRKTKEQIRQTLEDMKQRQNARTARLTDRCNLQDYAHRTYKGVQHGAEVMVWTDALQQAVNDHEIVYIPAAEEPYYMDGTVVIPSNRRVEAAEGAVICQLEGVQVLMFRNEHTHDGTHTPISGADRDENIAIIGGRWEESYRARAGYGRSGRYDEQRSFYGVSTCMLFNNITGVMLKNMTFAHTAGFSVQMGDIAEVVIENITFCACYADGIHLNGNSEQVWVHGLTGSVGDDLLALNMYDWQNSSVNFGPGRMIWAEELIASPDSRYKAMRIEPGVYYYADGTSVDCGLYDTVVRRVQGVRNIKLYLQTPPYDIAAKNPEPGGVGSADNLFFEDMALNLDYPADHFGPYKAKDPVRGRFGAFEVGANIGRLTLENIRLTLYPEKQPLSCLLTVGPKSAPHNGKEIFDPYVRCRLDTLVLSGVTVNGIPVTDPARYVQEIVFDDLYGDGFSSGRGEIGEIVLE